MLLQETYLGKNDCAAHGWQHFVLEQIFRCKSNKCIQCLAVAPRMGTITISTNVANMAKVMAKFPSKIYYIFGCIDKLSKNPLGWSSIQQVSERLVLVFRLLNLSRSIDLARAWGCISQVGDQAFVLTKRKNQKRPQW